MGMGAQAQERDGTGPVPTKALLSGKPTSGEEGDPWVVAQ